MQPLPITHLPMPEMCCYCEHYCFRPRAIEENETGWAFCKLFNRHFPDQFNGAHKPAGERWCKNYVQKGTVNNSEE